MSAPSIEHRVAAIGGTLHRVVDNLRGLGFCFVMDDCALPGPELGTSHAIAKIEREIGELPRAIKVFWTTVGSVDLRGNHPSWWGCDAPDPLIVYPPSVAVAELDAFVADREARLRADFPYVVPIAPDSVHKSGASGGMWINVRVPATADNPPLCGLPVSTPFLDYIELVIAWGGFPGLRRTPGHEWPLTAIVDCT